MYPNLRSQGDLESHVKAEYEAKHGSSLPSSFLERMLDSRANSIKDGIEEGCNIKLDRLGKLTIPPSRLDKKAIKEHLGDNYTKSAFKAELKRRAEEGVLNVQNRTIVNDNVKAGASMFNIAKPKRKR